MPIVEVGLSDWMKLQNNFLSKCSSTPWMSIGADSPCSTPSQGGHARWVSSRELQDRLIDLLYRAIPERERVLPVASSLDMKVRIIMAYNDERHQTPKRIKAWYQRALELTL